MIPDILGLNCPLQLPQQLQWKFGHEPKLLEWTIRARSYNTFVANFAFLLMLASTSGIAIMLYHAYKGMSQPWRMLSCMFFMAIMLIAILSITHQKMNFAYRTTQSGIEYCEWKDFPQWALTLLKWLTPVTFIIFLCLASIDPGFLIGALVGSGGLGLTYLPIAHSKSFRDMHTEYHHHEFKWNEFLQMAIATNREVVDLKYIMIAEEHGYDGAWNFNIFCKRKQKEHVADLIRPYLPPGVPIVRARVNVPLSTD